MKLYGIAEAFYGAYNRHDTVAVAALYDVNATHQDIATGHSKVGPDIIVAGLAKFLGWFSDARWEPRLQISDPSGSLTVTYLLTATLGAQMGQIVARGQRISLRGAHVLQVHGGLIRSSEDYWDAATFQKQINNV
jgi:hypothetical protein